MTAPVWAAFVAAAAIGAPLRYLLGGLVGRRTGGFFPWGTFIVNVSGSLLLGFLTGLGLYHGLPKSYRLVLGTGFCGAFTTFSGFNLETVRLATEESPGPAWRYAAGSVLACAAAAALGLAGAAI